MGKPLHIWLLPSIRCTCGWPKILTNMCMSEALFSESKNLTGNGNFPSLREVPRRCTHIFPESEGSCTSCKPFATCMMCSKTTSGLVKRVCVQRRQTHKREERLKHHKERTTPWNHSTNQTWSSARATGNRRRRFVYRNYPHERADLHQWPHP